MRRYPSFPSPPVVEEAAFILVAVQGPAFRSGPPVLSIVRRSPEDTFSFSSGDPSDSCVDAVSSTRRKNGPLRLYISIMPLLY